MGYYTDRGKHMECWCDCLDDYGMSYHTQCPRHGKDAQVEHFVRDKSTQDRPPRSQEEASG